MHEGRGSERHLIDPPLSEDSIIGTYRQALLDFLAGPHRNQHVKAGPVTTYLRKSARPLDGKIDKGLDLASIDIEPAWQQKGLAGRILDLLEAFRRERRQQGVRSIPRASWLRHRTPGSGLRPLDKCDACKAF